jgi:dihydropyrimidinase
MAFAETCPQYLFLSLDDMANGFEGAKYVCSPPLRPADHQAELWKGLVKDDLQVVSTDHCPFDFEGQKDLGKGDFRKVPNGLPGVEDRVDLLHDGGVVGGRMTRERWVEVISTAPAKLFGMYPRKGAIAVGSDADLVIYDPNRTRTISAKTHHMDVDYSCYEGRSVRGASDIVLSRGSVIVRDGEFTGRKGHGTFVRRGVADYARLS